MKIKHLLLLFLMLVMGGNVWAEEEIVYKTVWSEDFETISQNNYGFTAANATAFAGQQELSNGKHAFHIYGGTVNGRTYNLSFASNENFNNYSDFIFEFDYAVTSGNTDATNLQIIGNAGTLFSVSAASSSTTASVLNSAAEVLGSINATKYRNPGTTGQNDLPANFYHFSIVSNENGVKLTVTAADQTIVVNNAVLSNSFAKIASMSIATGRYYTHQLIDDIKLSIPQKTIVTTTKSWNLKNISATTIWIGLDDSEVFNINGTTMKKSTSAAAEGLLFDSNGSVWRVGNFGLRQQSSNGSRNIGIPSLKAGDVVTVVGAWSGAEASVVTDVSANATISTSADNKVSTITMTSDGDLSIGLRRNASSNYYSAESIELVHKEIKYSFTAGDDATMAINNPAPETAGNANGWNIVGNGNLPFVIGTLFENWNDNHAEASFDYYQTIIGLTNGYYVVGADVFSDQGSINGAVGLYASSNGVEVHAPVTKLATVETVATPVIQVVDGTLRIGVKNWATIAANWFHANNFTLTYIGTTNTLALDEAQEKQYATGQYSSVIVQRSLSSEYYSPLCLPFAYTPSNWEVYELTGQKQNGENVSLTLTEVNGTMEAGKPYIVKPNSVVTEITANDVTVIALPSVLEGEYVNMIGNFAPTTLHQGDYYVATGSQIKCLTAETASMKGFRAYFQEKAAGARSLDFSFGDETAIDVVNTLTSGKVEIYDLNGRRFSSLQKGINIINGKKVMVK